MALVLGFTGLLLCDAFEVWRTTGDRRPRPPLYGIWHVEEFVADGQVRPPLTTDTTRWERMLVDNRGVVIVRFMDQATLSYEQTTDTDTTNFVLKKFDEPAWKAEFTCVWAEKDVLKLDGIFDGRKVTVRCRRIDVSSLPLVNRGFHWINERPFLR
jgi:hypothetical protein